MDLEELLTFLSTLKLPLKLIAALDRESLHPGDANGGKLFVKLLNDLRNNENGKEVVKNENVRTRDIEKIMEIIIAVDFDHLLPAIINHPYLPNVSSDDPIMISSLRKAIRTGSLKTLNYLINCNVQVFTNDQNREKEMQVLMFQIVKAVEIGITKNRIECLKAAEVFFTYFLKKCYEFTFQRNINEVAMMATVPTSNKEEMTNEKKTSRK